MQITKPLPARNIRLTSSVHVGESFAGEHVLPNPRLATATDSPPPAQLLFRRAAHREHACSSSDRALV